MPILLMLPLKRAGNRRSHSNSKCLDHLHGCNSQKGRARLGGNSTSVAMAVSRGQARKRCLLGGVRIVDGSMSGHL